MTTKQKLRESRHYAFTMLWVVVDQVVEHAPFVPNRLILWRNSTLSDWTWYAPKR